MANEDSEASRGFVPHLVSVIIPSYNRYDHLLRAVHSVKSQSYPLVEIIVVNDASTDPNYYQRLEGVHMIHLAQNSGGCPGTVRNYGVRFSSGEYVAFLDDDDVWKSEKLTVQISSLNAAHKAETRHLMCCSVASVFHDNSETCGNLLLCDDKKTQLVPKDYATLPEVLKFDDMEITNPVITSSVVLHRDLIELLPHLFSNSRYAQDWGLWKRCSQLTGCVLVKEPLVVLDTSLIDRSTNRWYSRQAILHLVERASISDATEVCTTTTTATSTTTPVISVSKTRIHSLIAGFAGIQ